MSTTLTAVRGAAVGAAREHLRQARAGIGALGDDDYGKLIRDGLERLTRQLNPE